MNDTRLVFLGLILLLSATFPVSAHSADVGRPAPAWMSDLTVVQMLDSPNDYRWMGTWDPVYDYDWHRHYGVVYDSVTVTVAPSVTVTVAPSVTATVAPCVTATVAPVAPLTMTVATAAPPVTGTVARLVTATSAPPVTTAVAIVARFVTSTATLTHLTTVATSSVAAGSGERRGGTVGRGVRCGRSNLGWRLPLSGTRVSSDLCFVLGYFDLNQFFFVPLTRSSPSPGKTRHRSGSWPLSTGSGHIPARGSGPSSAAGPGTWDQAGIGSQIGALHRGTELYRDAVGVKRIDRMDNAVVDYLGYPESGRVNPVPQMSTATDRLRPRKTRDRKPWARLRVAMILFRQQVQHPAIQKKQHNFAGRFRRNRVCTPFFRAPLQVSFRAGRARSG